MKKVKTVRFKFWIIFLVWILFASGCGMKQQFMGDFYLTGKKYRDGIRYFETEIQKNPDEAKSHYYLGRYYLAEKQAVDGLKHLEHAAKLEPSNAYYHFWLGVAYSENKQPDLEIKSYEKSLELNPHFLKCRVYLAHTQFERKLYEDSLANYSIVLKNWQDEPASLYNRALCLMYLGRTKEEKTAWKEYLDFYPSGLMTRNAVEHLNRLGDFSYRNHIIGPRIVTLRKIQFEPFSDKLTGVAKDSLDFLGEILSISREVSIHVVVYQKNNLKLAEQKAKNIKRYLDEKYSGIQSSRINISWFDVPEKISIGDRIFNEDESVNFFTAS